MFPSDYEGSSDLGYASWQYHESISGEILQFDLNNLSVASKLGKLEKRHKNTLKKALKKAHGPPKGPPF